MVLEFSLERIELLLLNQAWIKRSDQKMSEFVVR